MQAVSVQVISSPTSKSPIFDVLRTERGSVEAIVSSSPVLGLDLGVEVHLLALGDRSDVPRDTRILQEEVRGALTVVGYSLTVTAPRRLCHAGIRPNIFSVEDMGTVGVVGLVGLFNRPLSLLPHGELTFDE
jgi:hypothetical protein